MFFRKRVIIGLVGVLLSGALVVVAKEERQISIVASEDTTYYNEPRSSSVVFGRSDYLWVGTEWNYVERHDNQMMAVLRFDMSGIPHGSVVTEARLEMAQLPGAGSGYGFLEVRDGGGPWTEDTLTLDSEMDFEGGTSWFAWDDTFSTRTMVELASSQGSVVWDVTPQLTDYIGSPWHDFVVKWQLGQTFPEPIGDRVFVFASKEGLERGDSYTGNLHPPVLKIKYREPLEWWQLLLGVIWSDDEDDEEAGSETMEMRLQIEEEEEGMEDTKETAAPSATVNELDKESFIDSEEESMETESGAMPKETFPAETQSEPTSTAVPFVPVVELIGDDEEAEESEEADGNSGLKKVEEEEEVTIFKKKSTKY